MSSQENRKILSTITFEKLKKQIETGELCCGAGRQALYFQEKGFDVVAIDNSPLAIEVCKKRGVIVARTISVSQISSTLGTFDTVIMFGNNFGLFGTPERAAA